MCTEIGHTSFSSEQATRFMNNVAEEVHALASWHASGRLAKAGYIAGFELEVWLLDHNYYP